LGERERKWNQTVSSPATRACPLPQAGEGRTWS